MADGSDKEFLCGPTKCYYVHLQYNLLNMKIFRNEQSGP